MQFVTGTMVEFGNRGGVGFEVGMDGDATSWCLLLAGLNSKVKLGRCMPLSA